MKTMCNAGEQGHRKWCSSSTFKANDQYNMSYWHTISIFLVLTFNIYVKQRQKDQTVVLPVITNHNEVN